MSTAVFIRRGRAIFPVDEDGEAMVLALAEDKQFMGEFRAARNPRQHRLWWALMTFLHEHNDAFKSKEGADEQIKLDTGHFDRVLNIRTGELREVTRSIAYASLAQKEFNDLFQRACDVICAEYVPGLASDALRDEIYVMIDGHDTRLTRRRA